MEIFPASTPLGISSSSNTTLWGKPALFLNTIFSPGLMLKLLGTKAKPPSSLPSKTSMAMALLASSALAAVAATATPTSLSEALMLSLGTAEAEAETLAVALTLAAPAAFRPVNDGMATAAEVTVAMDKDFSFFCFVLLVGGDRKEQRGGLDFNRVRLILCGMDWRRDL
ncbi:hypothetical protein F2P56_018198, partial [Juglans regia]